VRTAHGLWTEREGLILRLDREDGATGWGEVAPLAGFGTESVEAAAEACARLGDTIGAEDLPRIPRAFLCLRSALGSALAELDQPTEPATAAARDAYLPVAALLAAGRAALAQIGPRAEAGFRTFKWKVGVGDAADELALLDDVCAALPGGARLRLDANGAWDRRRAELWLERCAERPIEFVEQPIAPGARRADDLLQGLAGDYPTPIALDESLSGGESIERWLGAGWPGIFVVKPALLGAAPEAWALLAKAAADRVVFSSALETAVGARAALRTAFGWPGTARALGFGVWPLFADARFDLRASGPFLYAESVRQLEVEALWTALS
jgi:O-succinylbenzoate synthase